MGSAGGIRDHRGFLIAHACRLSPMTSVLVPAARPAGARASLARVPELRQLFEAGRDYLLGRASLYQLHARVCHVQTLARAAGAAPPVRALLDEWAARVERRWSAGNVDARGQAESEFGAWLRGQVILPPCRSPRPRAHQSRSACA